MQLLAASQQHFNAEIAESKRYAEITPADPPTDAPGVSLPSASLALFAVVAS
jgi:hypothetical protein